MLGTTLLFDRLDDDLRQQHGLSLVEYEILVRLSEAEDPLRMARLADSLAHSRSRVTHTVKRMEAGGLVARCGSTEDGRGVVCQLTERGDLLLRNVAPTHVDRACATTSSTSSAPRSSTPSARSWTPWPTG